MESNGWNEDTDSEYEEEYNQNETPPPALNQDFKDNILRVKHSLYENTVLAPELGSPKVQDNTVIQDYLNNLNEVYLLAIVAQNGKVSISQNKDKLNKFPPATRDIILNTIEMIEDFFSKNNTPDTIPYKDFIRKSFHEYQFIQDNSFDQE
jgi:hypothetical protein